MKFHEHITLKQHTVCNLEKEAGNRKSVASIKRMSPAEFLQEKIARLIERYGPDIQAFFSGDPAGCLPDNFQNAVTGIRFTVTTITEADWFDVGRPYYNVYPIVEKLVRNTKLNLPLSQLNLVDDSLCFRFPKGHEPLGIRTALIKIRNFDTPNTQKFKHLFASKENPSGVLPLVMAGFFDCGPVGDDRFIIQIPETVLNLSPAHDDPDAVVTVEDMLLAATAAAENAFERGAYEVRGPVDKEQFLADMPVYKERLAFLVKLVVLTSLLADGNDLITPAVLASEQEKYDLEIDEAAKRWMEERAAKIQGRGFDFGKKLQAKSDLSPHWRNPHLALYWTGEGRTKPVLKPRAGSVVIPKHLSSVPTGYDCPVQDDAAQAAPETVYFLREPSQGLIKIGRTKRSVADRQRESSTFVPGGLSLVGYIPTGDCVALETRLHREYAHVRRDNEFFAISHEDARTIISKFGGVYCG